ncbi:hydroxymethylbilane synthase [Planotetraspora phitsanulokensis]|uniref:Hydroxymethylbilane synthase n=1 Tax=Planotetraspora phitsanulokensis TaxID=575192 RepID=A0A8J3UDE3_9ACTN|nr:hydroxymethylbilane synthase [Planotetraspora phitsanulokensis]GII41281.1 porphobilinogen deaminase 2 [Planotetraspora phitsanulokensis]
MNIHAALAERFAGAPLRIGTRTSVLAMTQAERVAALIGEFGVTTEVVPIRVTSDLWSGDLSEVGGKAAFTKQIDRSLVGGEVDVAVHCVKDVPGDVPLPEGTAFGAHLEREDVHDVIVSRDGTPLADIPAGSLIGTGSVRRRAQLCIHRPDLRTQPIRGNVDSRLDRLREKDGPFAALILARAGLRRLGLADQITEILPVEFHTRGEGVVSIVPPVGAGVIGVQARTADAPVMRMLDELNHPATAGHILAERSMLHLLRGHCNSPIAGYATTTPDGRMSLFGMVFDRDGSQFVRSHAVGDPADPATLGSRVAADLLNQGAGRLIAATRR